MTGDYFMHWTYQKILVSISLYIEILILYFSCTFQDRQQSTGRNHHSRPGKPHISRPKDGFSDIGHNTNSRSNIELSSFHGSRSNFRSPNQHNNQPRNPTSQPNIYNAYSTDPIDIADLDKSSSIRVPNCKDQPICKTPKTFLPASDPLLDELASYLNEEIMYSVKQTLHTLPSPHKQFAMCGLTKFTPQMEEMAAFTVEQAVHTAVKVMRNNEKQKMLRNIQSVCFKIGYIFLNFVLCAYFIDN